MKTIKQLIDERASCRNYHETEIPEKVMKQILEAACKTPSGGGFQNYSIIRVNCPELKRGLSDLSRGQKFIASAPENLVFCIDYRRTIRISEHVPFPFNEHQSWFSLWMAIIDTAISAHQAVITAESLGLKSVYVGNILNHIDEVSELLDLPKYVVPSIMVTLGYPKSIPKITRKFDSRIMIHENKYQEIPNQELVSAYHEKYSDWSMKPKDSIVEKICQTALKQGGKKDYLKVKNWIEENGRISAYQYWFGAYYAKELPIDAESLMAYMISQGIDPSN